MSNMRFAVGVLGYLLILLGVLFPFTGCVVGGRAGYRAANGPPTVGQSSIFSQVSPPETMPEFWVVQYPADADVEPHPRLVDLADPDLGNIDWSFGPPAVQSRLAVGPWEQPPQWSQDWGEQWGKPIGDLEIRSGGVQFHATNDQATRVELVLYPAHKQDGWDRWYYIYDIADKTAIPVSAYREANISDWTGESVFVYSIGGLFIGTVVGIMLVALGLTCVFATKD